MLGIWRIQKTNKKLQGDGMRDMTNTLPSKTCSGGIYTANKWTYLGRRSFCLRYKRVMNDRCIDYRRNRKTNES